jgi:methylated-DNA-protein-cysteine methyltransferase-like protein
VVRQIPKGHVATYGQVAELAGLGGHARQVGYALHGLGRSGNLAKLDAVEIAARVPWHRVVNARGEISARSDPDPHETPLQRVLLEEEGVVFDLAGRMSLARFRWDPRHRPS